jgi:hypothetical protein
MNSSLAPNDVKTALDLVFDAQFSIDPVPGYATVNTGGLFMEESIDRAAYIAELFQGVGYFETRAEEQDVPGSLSRIGNQKTFSVINYAKSIDISKNFFDDDQHQVVNMMIKNFARNAALSQSKNAFGAFSGGFSTVTSADGVALFSDSHVALDGTTIDNLVSGALDETTLNTAFNSLITQKTQDGTLGGHTPAILLVPTALFKTAMEVTASELRSGSMDNDLNYFSKIYPGLQVYHSPFLGAAYGGSDTAWYLLSKDHTMMRYVRQGIDTALVDWKTQRNNNYIYKAEYREVVAPLSFEGLVASLGT